jgi:hypothetical protein
MMSDSKFQCAKTGDVRAANANRAETFQCIAGKCTRFGCKRRYGYRKARNKFKLVDIRLTPGRQVHAECIVLMEGRTVPLHSTITLIDYDPGIPQIMYLSDLTRDGALQPGFIILRTMVRNSTHRSVMNEDDFELGVFLRKGARGTRR